jgi:hypothetical protein
LRCVSSYSASQGQKHYYSKVHIAALRDENRKLQVPCRGHVLTQITQMEKKHLMGQIEIFASVVQSEKVKEQSEKGKALEKKQTQV